MSAVATHPVGLFAPYHPVPQATGPILVASDASPQSDAAFPLANALAEHLGLPVQVISGIQPMAMPLYAFDALPVPLETDLAARIGREGMLKGQMARLVSPDTAWPLIVRTGEPARDIADLARDLDARLIVVGRGRHAALQRALGGETVLRLLQLGDSPVLAADARLTTLPSRVVIGTDFSEFSLYAAQVTMPLLAPNAIVYLVHVAPPFEEHDPVLHERAVAYRTQARQAFAQLHSTLAHDSASFVDVLVDGNPSDEMIKVIRSTNAELVVSATHGYGFLRRMILGSVAAELVRHAPCSVLCVPGSARTVATARVRMRAAGLDGTRSLDMDALDAELKAFTDRNARRTCTVQVDGRHLGAQYLGHALPFVGATYDRRTGIVSLMFGASALAGQHLTHAITGVTAMDAMSARDGTDQALRIAHTDGYTLLTLD